MRAKLSLGPPGAVTLAPGEAEALGLSRGGEVEVASLHGGYVLVTPARAAAGWLAGSLQALSFPEVAELLTSTLRSGVLGVSGGEGGPPRRRTVVFREGQIVFASSSDPADRLGPVLWRAGVVPRPVLEAAGQGVRPGRPLGQVLVDEGVLTAAELYDAIVAQVREIVLACCLERAGEFAFREGEYEERNAVKLPERPRELLLAGVKRADELERLTAELPDPEAPLVRLREGVAGLDLRAARLAELADGRPLSAAIAAAELGAYHGLRAAAALVRAGVVAARPRPPPLPAPPAPPPAEEPGLPAGAAFERYRALLGRVHAALREVMPAIAAAQRLNGYLDRLPAPERALFDGVRLDEAGDLEAERVLVNVDAAGAYAGAAARARALEALDGFLTFALFEAGNALPRERAAALAAEVKRLQR